MVSSLLAVLSVLGIEIHFVVAGHAVTVEDSLKFLLNSVLKGLVQSAQVSKMYHVKIEWMLQTKNNKVSFFSHSI